MDVDPFTLSTISNAAGQLLADGVTRALRLINRPGDAHGLDEGPYELFTSSNSAEVLIFSTGQVEAINFALADARMVPLIEAACLAKLVLDRESHRRAVSRAVEEKFVELTKDTFESNDIPVETALLIWNELDEQLTRVLGPGVRELLTADERSQLLRMEGSVAVKQDRKSEIPGWLLRLIDVATDRDRLIELTIRSSEIRRQSLNRFGKLELRHSLDASEGRPLDSLYIHRVLQTPEGGHVSSEETFTTRHRGRVVVTGPPGNGKSTLTQYLIATLASQDQNAMVPLLLRVREADLDTSLLTHEMAASIRRLYQDSVITVDHIEDILTLGRALVIFDGLDEILDRGKRQAFVAKIEAFAHQYPLCSILATSRENGYEDAPFSKTFTKYKLLPFSQEQVHEYAAKWFSADPDGRDLTTTFLRDAKPVAELSENPLMLSLLCILYRNRGYIPRNRRAVYKDCADLLFRRWDSMRDIEQPTDHVEHGEDLMEEIALFYFKSQTAQGGVQERQLQNIIAQYLGDSAGVLPAQAKYRAKQFLNFCAGRAWLLGVDGTHAGERLFSFTHRTFMEYFAAEGMVRTNSDSGALAEVIIREYQKSKASVLPDLIVMAAEAGTRGRVRDLLEEIKKRERLTGGKGDGRFLPLRMRIASVLNLQPKHFDLLMTEAFEKFETGWDELSMDIADAIFRLPRDPRARVEAFVLEPSALGMSVQSDEVRRQRQELLIRAWVEHELNTGESLRNHEWSAVLARCWDEYQASGPTEDRWIRYYQRFYRNETVQIPRDDLAWVITRQSTQRYGPYSIAAFRAILGSDFDSLEDIVREFDREKRPSTLSYRDAYFVAGGVLAALDESVEGRNIDARFHKILLTAAFLFWEVHGMYDDYAVMMGNALGVPFAALIIERVRNDADYEDEGPSIFDAVSKEEAKAVREFANGVCGAWAVRWIDDHLNLIQPMDTY